MIYGPFIGTNIAWLWMERRIVLELQIEASNNVLFMDKDIV